MIRSSTRRDFLTLFGAGVAAFACASGRSRRTIVQAVAKPLRFAFLTDVHARTEWDTPLALEMATRAVNDQGVDLVIAGGDLTAAGFHSSLDEALPRWEIYRNMHDTIESPVYPVLGNQDLVAAISTGVQSRSEPRETFLTQLGLEESFYSFDVAGYHFVVLDSVHVTGDDLDYEGRISTDQLRWLRDDLKATPEATPVILACHMPLLTAFYPATTGATSTAPRNRVVVNNLEVLDLFAVHDLLLVLQGHLHIRERIEWRGITFLTGGAICGSWWRGPSYGAEEGFYVVTLRGRDIDLDYVDYGWEARRPKAAP